MSTLERLRALSKKHGLPEPSWIIPSMAEPGPALPSIEETLFPDGAPEREPDQEASDTCSPGT